MKIQTDNPIAVYGMGNRTNNEDNLFPPAGKASADDTLFMVCDGVGGSEKGEIASEIACRAVAAYYRQNRITGSDDNAVHNAIAFARAEMERYVGGHPGSQGMATTVTFLHLHDGGATVAHIGDSRVYHIRNGKILWHTRDHSYVNDLVKAGVITEEQALTHPRRNVIMRALQGHDPETLADIHHITDLAAGDYFFLCSDGILESVDETQLTDILAGSGPHSEKMEQVRLRCEAHSNDNFTAYLVPVRSVEVPAVELLPDATEKRDEEKQKPVDRNSILNAWLIVAVLVASSGWYLWHHRSTPVVMASPPSPGPEPVGKDSVIKVHMMKTVKHKPQLKKDKKEKKETKAR